MNGPAPLPFSVMTKPVSGTCNLACDYCYYTEKPALLYPDTSNPRMPVEVLQALVEQTLQAMPQRADFVWQGGEPLLAGREFFAEAVRLQRRLARPGQMVVNSLQTNGTLMDDDWARFFRQHGFLVGISLDGPQALHDLHRRNHAGAGSWDRAWQGLRALRRQGVEHNVLVTLNSGNVEAGLALYESLVDSGLRYLQFIPILERDQHGQPLPFSCSPAAYGEFLSQVFQRWVDRDVGRVSVRFFDNLIHRQLFGTASTCCFAPRCANALVLEWNGDVFACDHFVYPAWHLGNILETPLAVLAQSPTLQRFATLKTAPPAPCVDCPWWTWCHGGCPKHHLPLYGGPERHNWFCEAYRTFLPIALPQVQRLAATIREQQDPAARSPHPGARRAAAGSSTALRSPAARNQPCVCGSGKKTKNCCGR